MPPLVCAGQGRRHRVGMEVPMKRIARLLRRWFKQGPVHHGPTGNIVVDAMFPGGRR